MEKQILNHVKQLILLPDGINTTVEMVSEYYEVKDNAMRHLILRHNEELKNSGLYVIEGIQLKSFKIINSIKSRARSLTIVPVKAILKFSTLLASSNIAQEVREELVKQNPKLYEELTNGHRLQFKKFEQKYEEYLNFSFGVENIQKQVNCGGYLIDFVLFNTIAIEIDENGHSSYSNEKEIIREKHIRSEGYNIVRFNPHKQKPYELMGMILKMTDVLPGL